MPRRSRRNAGALAAAPLATTRILIADGHALVRAGLRALLACEPDLAVAGEATDALEAVRLCRRLKPDVAVLDLTMPGAAGSKLIGAVRRVCPRTRVLILTIHDGPPSARSAMAAGAAGYVDKAAGDTELLAAIRAVRQGRTFLDVTPDAASDATRPDRRRSGASAAPRLSRRLQQVLELLALGHTNRQIADRLGVGVKTVETYRARLLQKLGGHDRADLVRHALDRGLLNGRPHRDD